MKNLRFDKQVAVITGAGKGVGRAQALELAARGASVVVNNRHTTNDDDVRSADTTVGEIVSQGGNAVANYADITDKDAAQNLMDTALRNFNGIDILILNAAISSAGMFHKSSIETFRKIMEINLFANVDLLQHAIPHMRAQRYGRILFTISSAGLYGVPGASAYSASKGAMHALMLSLASEGTSRGIHCNAIAPFASSQMTDAYLSEAHKRALSAAATLPAAIWLAHKDCPANGQTWVAAGNQIRRAHVVETLGQEPVMTAEEFASNFATLSDMTEAENFESANGSFASMLDSIGVD